MLKITFHQFLCFYPIHFYPIQKKRLAQFRVQWSVVPNVDSDSYIKLAFVIIFLIFWICHNFSYFLNLTCFSSMSNVQPCPMLILTVKSCYLLFILNCYFFPLHRNWVLLHGQCATMSKRRSVCQPLSFVWMCLRWLLDGTTLWNTYVIDILPQGHWFFQAK